MDIRDFRYSVAIRTLGLSGDKFQKELDSLDRQSIRPEKIIVYLAEGYDAPKETIGWEQIVRVKKGMVAQRALPYNEIETPYILMLDDDVYIPEDGVEKLAKGLLENGGDCIAADTYPNHKMSIAGKIKAFISNWACPMQSEKWAIKIQRTGSFFYNNHPAKDVYLAQSAAGPCSLWRKDAFIGIRFEDDRRGHLLGRLPRHYRNDEVGHHLHQRHDDEHQADHPRHQGIRHARSDVPRPRRECRR